MHLRGDEDGCEQLKESPYGAHVWGRGGVTWWVGRLEEILRPKPIPALHLLGVRGGTFVSTQTKCVFPGYTHTHTPITMAMTAKIYLSWQGRSQWPQPRSTNHSPAVSSASPLTSQSPQLTTPGGDCMGHTQDFLGEEHEGYQDPRSLLSPPSLLLF